MRTRRRLVENRSQSQPNRTRIMRLLSLFALVAGIAAAVPASAATRTIAEPDRFTRQRFDIPSQPLTSALEAFSHQTGLTVELGAAASSIVTKDLRGSFTQAEALRRLLAGS